MAIKRFYSLERKLEKNEELKAQYGAFLTEYSELGHMSPVDANLQTQGEYYLPHHAVENCNSTTNKLRVVFDASAKTTNNLSLNDVLMTGPVIQEELFSILLRARKHNVVITADVSKMYRQIEIKSGQRNFQRIVWRNSPDQPLSHFNLNTVTYGTAPASFLATRCIYQIALEHREKFPVASEIVMSDFYVDDLITGAPDIASATILIRDIIQILSSGCFPLRKWNSNKLGVIYSSLTDTANSEENFLINDSKNSKTLGVMWNRDLDIFKYVSGINGNKMVPSTKRQILSVISQIFDPLGLVGPVTIRSKVILQKLWSLKMDWDESIPQDLFTSWCKIYENLSSLEKIQIPRQIVLTNFVLLEIHAFSDASQIAYGACVYARSQASDGRVAVRLITAKSRVAPLKAQTIPRLELCAAQLLSQLVVKTISALKMTVNRVYCWTDSSIVLAWLSTESSTLKTFVSHRVAEIQTNTCGFQWRYVPTDQNPADIISRGLEPSQLASSSLWWEGPTFLSCTENSWPPNIYTKPQGLLEVKNNVISLISTVPRPEIFHRFSDFRKLVHVTAYIMRFVNNASPKRPKLAGNLSVSEVTNAKIMLLKLVQISEFAQELHALKRGKNIALSSKLKCHDPFLDESGLIRVGGRLKNADLEFDHKYPIVLPGNHPFTTLVIRYEHVKNFHAGHQATLANVRQSYWPLSDRRIVRTVLRSCVRCFKCRPKFIQPKMSNLPASRVTPSRPFLITGLDYAGPFLIKNSQLRNRTFIKSYICVFVCFASKAVHLELVGDLTAESFLNAFKRFASRRGLCQEIYSDNATNFVRADKDLKAVLKTQRQEAFQTYLLDNEIVWKFSPARSPHFGGLFEAAVKSAKAHLKMVFHGAKLTYEELYTICAQIEAIMNSRPIYPLSSDPNDIQFLTPGHSIIGQSMVAVPQTSVNLEGTHLSRYKQLQALLQHFWVRWRHDYLNTLQQRTKWQFSAKSRELLGALVLLKEENVPPQVWPMGRIVSQHPGEDGEVRVVEVKTANSVVKRALNKVCLLPLET